ncbi:hypothetical protein BCY84_05320 [Trypanosoma cruzi cruzi]|uniref:Uncharacterized protein n=1 Tax=Trypanosoma cruzi TaxID=5693 RepID=A0A2V2VH10_TRYCR|nr:hypothetical protein BCY84_05320 [Trypanosoma cruzi cruzi]PWU95670.1 hypothetical protein C4B63_21g117 [Trypanosoma cruzi]
MKVIPPSLLALQQHIASLPFDVLIRRIHSSSQGNPARSLEAHFIGARSHLARGKGQGFAELPQVSGERLASTSSQNAETMVVSSLQLRELLSERLLQDVQQPRTRLQLNVDDLSLVLANAVRHKFSFRLTNTTLRRFTETLNGAWGKDAASQQIEALSRVMEACCDGLEGNDLMTWDDLANLVAMVEQRWSLFTKSNSLCCLLLQFFSSVIAVEVSTEVPMPGILRADPVLLKERCLQLVHDATDILADTFEAGIPLTWSPAELQGMCSVVKQLRHYEHVRSSLKTSSLGRVRFWKRTAATAPAEPADAVPVYKQLSRLVTTQVLSNSRLVTDVEAMTLAQVAGVFSSVSFACGTEAILRFTVPVQNVLKRVVVADATSMRHVICIGEASLHVEGASLLFVEAVRSISRFAFVLTSAATWDLLCRVCALLEGAPLSLRAVVVMCLCSLQGSLEKSRRLPSSASPEFASFRLAVAMVCTLLAQHKVQTGLRMEEIIHSVVEAAPMMRDGGKSGAATLVRCFFFLTSTRSHANSERQARAIHLAMAEASRLLNEKNEDHPIQLTNAEQSMLRNSLKRYREMLAHSEAKRNTFSQGAETQHDAPASSPRDADAPPTPPSAAAASRQERFSPSASKTAKKTGRI